LSTSVYTSKPVYIGDLNVGQWSVVSLCACPRDDDETIYGKKYSSGDGGKKTPTAG